MLLSYRTLHCHQSMPALLLLGLLASLPGKAFQGPATTSLPLSS